MPLQSHVEKTKILYLGLCLVRVLFGISLGLRLNTLGFGDHALDGEIILGGIGLSRWLNSFILPLILRPRTLYNVLFLLCSPC